MSKERMSGAERRTQILQAARRVFSERGYDRAKTLEIARAAKVSEALVYRHFPSKLSLYRAVLRQVFREQDENWQVLGIQAAGARGLIGAIKAYFTAMVQNEDDDEQSGFRMTLASLAADGSFASLIYRRSQRRNVKALETAHREAREAGDLIGENIHLADTAMFIEHVGTMLRATHALPPSSRPYHHEGADLIRHAVWFCCRGIGITEEALSLHYDG